MGEEGLSADRGQERTDGHFRCFLQKTEAETGAGMCPGCVSGWSRITHFSSGEGRGCSSDRMGAAASQEDKEPFQASLMCSEVTSFPLILQESLKVRAY